MTVLNSFQILKELRKGFENHFEVAYNVLLNSHYMLMTQIWKKQKKWFKFQFVY